VLVRLGGPAPVERPDQTLHSVSGLATGYLISNADGNDGGPLTDYDVIGSRLERTGLFALDSVEYFNLLCIPPLSREQDVGASLLLVAARYCKEHRAMLVVDPPAEWLTADDAVRGLRQWSFRSENALMYFPRILAHDKLRGHFESFGSCGAVAGMLARCDEYFPVWGRAKSEDAVLRPGYRPACLITEDRRMTLAARGVNTIQAVRSAARIGVQPRTLAAGTAGSPDWQYLAARRLALFIVNSIERSTRWVVLTKPHREVGGLASVQVAAFFEWLRAEGAFGGRPVDESYVVICDQRANPNDSAASDFQLLIGFAAQRGHDFHCFRILHCMSGSRITPVSLNRSTVGQLSPEEREWVDTLADQLRPLD
jgi:phage tail sheath protein FI